MALLNLLTNSNLRAGSNITFISKGIKTGLNESPFHLKRVEWDITDPNADPVYLLGESHGGNDIVDGLGIARGGFKVAMDRRKIDFERISNFLYNSPQGTNFLLRQTGLQLLNKQDNQRIFNGGVNMLAQIAVSGLSNIKREGLTPIGAVIDAIPGLGITGEDGYVDYFVEEGSLFQSVANIKGLPRETKYGTGDPGKPSSKSFLDSIKDLNPFKKKSSGYNVSIKDNFSKIDKINLLDVFTAPGGIIPTSIEEQIGTQDMVNFRFEVVDSDNPENSDFIIFRAFLDSLNDNYSANHNSIKYNGRGENFYTYNNFDRSISLGFKIAAQTRNEMWPLYRKLNYLAAQTAPNYSSTGRIRTPYMKLTLGDYFNRLPGVLTSVTINWQKDYSWEIKNDKKLDADMLVLPHVLDISVNFKPIHNFTPKNSLDSPFIGIDKWVDGKTPSTSAQSIRNQVNDRLNNTVFIDVDGTEISQDEFFNR